MSDLNFFSSEGLSSDTSLRSHDFATQRAGFGNFVSEYKLICDKNWPYEKIVSEAKRRWSEMSIGQRAVFSPMFDERPIEGCGMPLRQFEQFMSSKDVLGNSSSDCTNQGTSLKSVSLNGEQLVDAYDRGEPEMSESSCACGDGFGKFLEEYTLKASEVAAQHWEDMTLRERAEYEPNFVSDASLSSFGTDYEQFAKDDMFDSCKPKKKLRCAKPKRKSCSKRKKRSCPAKPKCPKRKAAKRCGKPKVKKSAKRKRRCPKMCPKPICPMSCMQPGAKDPMSKN